MNMALFCGACGVQLTPPLAILSGKDPAVTAPEHKDQMPLTQRGTAFKSYEPLRRTLGEKTDPLEFVPQVWVNPEDLLDVVRLTKDGRRLNGCCGLDGCGGPNQLCVFGAEIGTLMSDCWTPHVFVAEPGTTVWNDV